MFDTLSVIQPTVLVGSTDAAMFISLLAILRRETTPSVECLRRTRCTKW